MKKLSLTLIIVLFLALVPVNKIVPAETIPTISIVGVTEDDRVTILTHGFPANRDFDVRMGEFATLGVDGEVVERINSGSGLSQVFTFEIPTELHEQDKIAIRLDSMTHSYFAFNWFYNTDFGSHDEEFLQALLEEAEKPNPIIVVVSVIKDSQVTIEGNRFPVDENFDVLMGEYTTEGVDGIKVGTLTVSTDGTVKKSFNIPQSLKSEDRMASRVESTQSDLFAHAWFENETGGAGGAGPVQPYTGIPTISIVSVQADETVTIQTHNYPANRTFLVLMGQMGTRGVGGIQVTSIASGAGGSFSETFEIPEGLKGNYQIAIRLQTEDGIFYSYNWFYNNTTTASAQPPSQQPAAGYTGIPTFSITGVVEDESVTINTNNFPANYDFKVLMGKMGTRGVGGIHVTTINSGAGGTFTDTYGVPSDLAGQNRIAIRLEATSGGYYAFNWFYNNTYP
jgi:hypothetical protein